MAEFPKLPLWTDAYLADTTHLTTIEHGAYLLLLIAMWRSEGCALPNDDKLLARYAKLTPGQWARIRPVLMPFFKVSSDSITQGRLTDEAIAVRQHSKKQSDKSKARWLKNKETDKPVDMPDASRDDASLSLSLSQEKKDDTNVSSKESPPVSDPVDLLDIPDHLRRSVLTLDWQPSESVLAAIRMAAELAMIPEAHLTDADLENERHSFATNSLSKRPNDTQTPALWDGQFKSWMVNWGFQRAKDRHAAARKQAKDGGQMSAAELSARNRLARRMAEEGNGE